MPGSPLVIFPLDPLPPEPGLLILLLAIACLPCFFAVQSHHRIHCTRRKILRGTRGQHLSNDILFEQCDTLGRDVAPWTLNRPDPALSPYRTASLVCQTSQIAAVAHLFQTVPSAFV